MDINVNQEFIMICKDILKEKRTEEEWAKFESDDMYQSESFVGGYDADEMAFCFSYYNTNGEEFWFQLTHSEIEKVVNGELSKLQSRPAE